MPNGNLKARITAGKKLPLNQTPPHIFMGWPNCCFCLDS